MNLKRVNFPVSYRIRREQSNVRKDCVRKIINEIKKRSGARTEHWCIPQMALFRLDWRVLIAVYCKRCDRKLVIHVNTSLSMFNEARIQIKGFLGTLPDAFLNCKKIASVYKSFDMFVCMSRENWTRFVSQAKLLCGTRADVLIGGWKGHDMGIYNMCSKSLHDIDV